MRQIRAAWEGGGSSGPDVRRRDCKEEDGGQSMPYWGSRKELAEVVELYRRGFIRVETSAFQISEVGTAYQMLRDGSISGRAVVRPNS